MKMWEKYKADLENIQEEITMLRNERADMNKTIEDQRDLIERLRSVNNDRDNQIKSLCSQLLTAKDMIIKIAIEQKELLDEVAEKHSDMIDKAMDAINGEC